MQAARAGYSRVAEPGQSRRLTGGSLWGHTTGSAAQWVTQGHGGVIQQGQRHIGLHRVTVGSYNRVRYTVGHTGSQSRLLNRVSRTGSQLGRRSWSVAPSPNGDLISVFLVRSGHRAEVRRIISVDLIARKDPATFNIFKTNHFVV